MSDTKDIIIDKDKIDPHLSKIRTHTQTLQDCRTRLDTISAQLQKTEGLAGYTADEVWQNNLRGGQALNGLHTLGDTLAQLINITIERMLRKDANIAEDMGGDT